MPQQLGKLFFYIASAVKFRNRQGPDVALRDVLLAAGAIRAKPILLTAVAAMISAATILPDPVFQGLAVSLLFGLTSSTLLTLLVIPAIYIVLRDDGKPASKAVIQNHAGDRGHS